MFDKNLCAHPGVDAGRGDVLVAAGVDVSGAETNRRSATVDVVPVVVVVCHTQLAAVLAAVAVTVAN